MKERKMFLKRKHSGVDKNAFYCPETWGRRKKLMIQAVCVQKKKVSFDNSSLFYVGVAALIIIID